jgi:aminopeptidase N
MSAASTKRGVIVSVCARASQVTNTAYALSMAANMTAYFESFLGVNYALSKVDLIAIPEFSSGAMENWGLILFRESALLIDKMSDPSR